MQRKAYVPGVAALLAALLATLAGCTGGSGDGGTMDSANPGDVGTTSPAAQPGRYRTLPEPCGAAGQSTLDSLLPGIRQITDEDQREKAYAGEATLTYDTDRKVGCRWKVESTDATDHLLIDFERVVSYDNSVSDDSQAQQLFAKMEEAADLPEAANAGDPSDVATGDPSTGATGSGDSPSAGPTPTGSASPSAPSTSASASSSPSSSPTEIQPRLLDGLGDAAFLDDALNTSGSTVQQRTVTVAFRTSNVIVTIEYAEQPAALGVVPDSEEMQDKAQKLAARLAEVLAG
ncbi:hypothetical protein [Streptomyces cellulosae]|uniref:hypothetical protein n=1 Tax=Streptomyces cellulosae TaxID=1968 RepID=UPI0004CA27A1|nr:hypothetical protein [Streptomyces cellulosae]